MVNKVASMQFHVLVRYSFGKIFKHHKLDRIVQTHTRTGHRSHSGVRVTHLCGILCDVCTKTVSFQVQISNVMWCDGQRDGWVRGAVKSHRLEYGAVKWSHNAHAMERISWLLHIVGHKPEYALYVSWLYALAICAYFLYEARWRWSVFVDATDGGACEIRAVHLFPHKRRKKIFFLFVQIVSRNQIQFKRKNAVSWWLWKYIV